MKSMKKFPALLVALILLGAALSAAIKFTPATPRVGQPVAFTLLPAFPDINPTNGITWSFGDGIQVQQPASQLSITHTFASGGTYKVNAVYYVATLITLKKIVESVQVTVSAAAKTIVFQPALPNTCETVTFQAGGFASAALRWEFGDGAVLAGGGASASHAYTNAGSFTVRVFDNNGRDANPASRMVTVSNKRSLALLTAQPRTGMPVSFQAAGFSSSCLLWDFGDGQPRVKGTAAAEHTYTSPGQFLVTAGDGCGTALCSASVSVTVESSQGPLAPFAISYVALRFEDGTTSRSVGQNTTGLAAYADLKFEGSGLLQAEWQVDGQPFQTTSQSLGFARGATIHTPKIPGLPTAIAGPHTVTLRIIKPAVSFIVPAINYFVAMSPPPPSPPPPSETQAAVINSIVPEIVEREKEYTLDLYGAHLTSYTVVSLGNGIAISSAFTQVNPQRGTMKIYVSKTAKLGDRLAWVNNGNGIHEGPGKIIVSAAAPPPASTCTDSCTLSMEKIYLGSLGWYFAEHLDSVDAGYQGHEGSALQPAKFKLETVNDFSILEWTMTPVYDYVEVRFYKAKTNQLFMVKRLEGSATSLRLDGRTIVEMFASFDGATSAPAPELYDHTMDEYAPEYADDLYNNWKHDVQEKQKIYQDALQAADVVWQVAGFRKYACVYNSKKAAIPVKYNQTIEIALSDIGLFQLPNRPNGMHCPDQGMHEHASVNWQNDSLYHRNEGKTGNDIANTNLVGDTFTISGSVSLAGSPYGYHPDIVNLFIDWGDGSGVKNIHSPAFNVNHTYSNANMDYTIRIFQLAEDDIQSSQFLSKLGKTLQPKSGSSGSGNPYAILMQSQWHAAGQGNDPAQESFAQIMDRAYMLYCQPLAIENAHDSCIDQPIKLLGLEIVDFPGHNIKKAVNPYTNLATDAIKLPQVEYVQLFNLGVDAVAVTCDKGLVATAKLNFVGTGHVEFLWRVDGQLVEKRTYEEQLISAPRPNLTLGQAQDCSQAIQSAKLIDSGDGVLPVKDIGRHEVIVQARVTAAPSATNLFQYASASALSLAGFGGAAGEAVGGHGPAASSGGAAGAGSDPLLQAMQQSQASGQAVPQIGFLNPDPAADGPAVAYLNDSLASAPGSWDYGSATDSLLSQPKHYKVNEVRNLLGCMVLLPADQPGPRYFEITDMGESAVLNDDDTYSGSGLLGVPYHAGNGSVKYKRVPMSFNHWIIDSGTGIAKNGTFDSHSQANDFWFPGGFVAKDSRLTRIRGGVVQEAAQPLMVTFDFDLGTSLLTQIQLGADHAASIAGAEGRLTVDGDWLGTGLHLDKTKIGKTQNYIRSDSVAIDLSSSQNPAQYTANGPGWMGVHFGDPDFFPYAWMFPANPGFAMAKTEEWVLQAGGLSGRAKSTPFSSSEGVGKFSFDWHEFGVKQGQIDGTYHNVAITLPWLGQPVTGNATLMISSNQTEIVPVLNLTSPPVSLTYSDPAQHGQLTMTASQFRFQIATEDNAKALECNLAFDLQCEGTNFASFAVNDFDFLFNGRAMFQTKFHQKFLALGISSKFGQYAATPHDVTLTTPEQGAERLGMRFNATLQYATGGMSAFIPDTAATIQYGIQLSGAAYALAGPMAVSDDTFALNFPLVDQDFKCNVKPAYTPQPGSGGSAGAGSGPFAGGDGDVGFSAGGSRFQAKIPLSIFGVAAGVEATFILGSSSQGSYFLTVADFDPLPAPIPLSPIPFSISAFKGGFGYNFDAPTLATADVNAVPSMNGVAAFMAGITLQTSDGFTLKGKASLAFDTGGTFQADLQNWALMGMGNFGGQIKYSKKNFDGCIFGHLKMLDGFTVIDFSLGDGVPTAKMNFHFGGGDWHVNAGSDVNPISANLWGLSAQAYLMLGNKVGLKTGGGISVVLPPGFEKQKLLPYFFGNLNVGLTITPQPHFSGNFATDIGVWLPVYMRIPPLFKKKVSVGASVVIEALPAKFQVCGSVFGAELCLGF